MFLGYKKISKKAVKFGSFLQCSGHIFLWHDDCVWKINLRIFWNHIIKNFQVKHGQCDSIILPQNIFFWRLYVIARPLPCCLQDSLLLICPGIYPKIYHRTPCPAVLIFKGSNKKQRRGRIISSFSKRETFSSIIITKCSWV